MVEQLGTPLELYNYHQNVFVAAFIGSSSMNIISGTLQQEGFCTADSPAASA